MKNCLNCSHPNTEESRYCVECGTKHSAIRTRESESPRSIIPFTEEMELTLYPTQKAYDVYISTARIIWSSVLSSGLYFVYWAYLSWRHLRQETEEPHYPIWHGLSFLIPVYGLFRLHKHMLVINQLALKKEIEPSLAPILAVAQIGLVWAISFALLQTTLSSGMVLLMNLIGLALTTVVPTLGQGTLNRYWNTIHGEKLEPARLKLFEIGIIGFGIFNWVGLLRSS